MLCIIYKFQFILDMCVKENHSMHRISAVCSGSTCGRRHSLESCFIPSVDSSVSPAGIGFQY